MNRRTFLKYASATTGALSLGTGTIGYSYLYGDKIQTRARIVIVGAGAGGLTTAAKLSHRLDGASITIVDGKEKHHYQPGFSLIGCGIYKPDQVIRENKDFIPDNVHWIREMVAEYNPEADNIITTSGKKISYDFLIVSAGVQLNYSAVSGLEPACIGKNGIGSIYYSPEKAEQTWHGVQQYLQTGGVGLFTKPAGRIKCAGAPLKTAFLAESRAVESGKRKNFKFSYLTGSDNLFSIKETNDMCARRCKEKKINVNYGHDLEAIDIDRKTAYFTTQKGRYEHKYDYIHIVPPMSAPDNIKQSPLSSKQGKHAKPGWLEVDQYSLQHRRFANVFGVGDIIGTPMGKTGASLKMQAPVVVKNIVRMIQGHPPKGLYNGYTSCPIATAIGCAAIIEFDYTKKLTPSLPFIDPNDDGLMGWYIKVHGIKPLYFQMIRGRVPV